jgi:hypothetical protein
MSIGYHWRAAVSAFAVALCLGGCASVKLPQLDLLKLPEFKEESENIGAYPAVKDAPSLPADVRKASEWDRLANDIIKKRDGVTAPQEPERAKTTNEIMQEIDRLTAEVNEYRADDPPQN